MWPAIEALILIFAGPVPESGALPHASNHLGAVRRGGRWRVHRRRHAVIVG